MIANTKNNRLYLYPTHPLLPELIEIMGMKGADSPEEAFAVVKLGKGRTPYDNDRFDQVSLHLVNGTTATMDIDNSGITPTSYNHLRRIQSGQRNVYTQVRTGVRGVFATHSSSSFGGQNYPVTTPPPQLVKTLQERAERVREFIRGLHQT
jgi:hypothetical protein